MRNKSETNGKRRLYNRYDLFVFAALIAVSAAVYIYMTYGRGTGKTICEIKINGKTVKTVNLSEPNQEFSLPDNPNIRFRIKDNAIAFIESDCPDKICVNTGYLRRAGQTAVCLPNRVTIHIAAVGDNNSADIIVP